MLLETFDISSQLLIFIGQLDIEILLEVHISLHVSDLAVPEVQLIALLGIVSLHKGDSLADVNVLVIFLFDVFFKMVDAVLQSLLVSVEGGSEGFSSFSFLVGSDFLVFKFLETLINLILLSLLTFESNLILTFALEFDLLEIFESGGEVAQIRSKLAILLGKLIDLLTKEIHLVNSCAVTHVDVKDGLNAMILLVKEVDLVLKLLHIALIGLLLILLRKLIHVLATLIEFAQPQNFIVSCFNGTVKLTLLLL